MSGVKYMRMETGSDALKFVRTLTGTPAWSMIFFALALFCACGAVYVAVIQEQISLLAGCGINTLLNYLIFTCLHEAGHGNIAGKVRWLKPVESIIGWVSGRIIWAPYPIWKILHTRHHSHTNHPEKDPDYFMASSNVFSAFLRGLLVTPMYIYTVVTKPCDQIRRIERLIHVLQVVPFMIIFGFAWFYGLAFPLLLYVVPAVLALATVIFTFGWMPHHPHSSQDRFTDSWIALWPGLSFLLVGQNYHLIHHLYPTLSVTKYGKAFREIRPVLEKNNARISGPESRLTRQAVSK